MYVHMYIIHVYTYMYVLHTLNTLHESHMCIHLIFIKCYAKNTVLQFSCRVEGLMCAVLVATVANYYNTCTNVNER